MVELLARGLQVLAALGGAYLLALWFVLIVWTYRDIEQRSNSVFTQIFSTLLVVLFYIPGVLLYLLLRPKETLDEAFQRSLEEEYLLQDLEDLVACPSCHRPAETDFVLCPHCQTQLRDACAGCGKLVDLKWPVCPYCALPRNERAGEGERVEPPAPRYISPEARRRRQETESAAATRPLPEAAAAVAGAAAVLQPMMRPLDRFRLRQAATGAAVHPASTIGVAGDELVRSLEPRRDAPPIGAGESREDATRAGDGVG
ncbi:MAG: zinc ribbon domain-containing protein, partial [Thermomicrobiales bacterium]|nr:zinc ribbon domain-containing protein [Thermomicrobiales bacterium]